MKRILVIIDLQNDFCPGGGLAVEGGNEIAQIINQLMEQGGYDLIVASKDWHPRGHKSFASSWEGKKEYELINLNDLIQRLWPTHCVEDTYGAEFVADLKAELIDEIVLKGTDPEIDSLSAFFDNARRKQTRMHEMLQDYCAEWGVDQSELQLDFVGLALDFCVAYSVQDAISLGYQSSLIVDATRAVNLSPGDDVKTIRDLAGLGCRITDSREVLELSRAHSRDVELSA